MTEKRKADRLRMAEKVKNLAGYYQIPAEIKRAPFGRIAPRLVAVSIKGPKGARLDIKFDGDSGNPDVFILSWYFDSESNARFHESFGAPNRHHWKKSTDVVSGFDALTTTLETRFQQLNDGSAFKN